MNKHNYLRAAFAPLVLALVLTGVSSVSGTIIAQYHFDETGGNTAFDSAGSFNGALSAAGAAFVPGGISGNAISLDQSLGGLVNMGTSFPGFTSGSFSLVCWVKTTTTLMDTIALAKHEAFTQNGYLIAINQTGGGGTLNKATFTAGSEFVSQSPTSTSSVNDGVWHQIVAVFNAGGSHSIYVDGAPMEASTASQGIPSNGAAFLIGGVNQSGTPNARYTGLIDEVQVYDQALNDAQIDFLFQNPTQVVPEPATLALLSAGLLACVVFKRRNSAQ
jgi:concanavalin A-like lectin/glucanase superfamily protein/PEP-CTERM motif-containing protein